MLGKCDNCGHHSLDCFCEKHIRQNDKFYYQGKFFEKEEEFWDYVKDFSIRQTSVEDFDSLFNRLKKDIWLNLSAKNTKINNSELRNILEETFTFIIKKCWKE
jgi:RNAse (barnase) inhibitor barstar